MFAGMFLFLYCIWPKSFHLAARIMIVVFHCMFHIVFVCDDGRVFDS